jgi:hypothetical protein
MTAMVMRLGPWRVERTLGRDLSGTYYAGRHDDGTRATLYLLSGDVVAVRRDALIRLLALHRGLSHSGLVRFHELDHEGSDLYLIADAVDDELASLRTGRPPPGQTRLLGAALAAALAAAHRCGLVHGGLELDNVLWAPGRLPQILGTGVAALGIADHSALAHGDVAALGRLLCALVAGRPPVGSACSRIQARWSPCARPTRCSLSASRPKRGAAAPRPPGARIAARAAPEGHTPA